MDNPNFYNNFPTNNYTFQNRPPEYIAQTTPDSSHVPQPSTTDAGCVPSIPAKGFVPTTLASGFVPSTSTFSVPTPAAPLPQALVPPPPLPPAFYMPPIVPMFIPETTMALPPQNPTDHTMDYFAMFSAQYRKRFRKKLCRRSKRSGEFQKYTPNPIDLPEPASYPKEYISQYTTVRMLERPTEYSSEYSSEESEDEHYASESPLETGPVLADEDFITNFEAKMIAQQNHEHYQPNIRTGTISIVEVKAKIHNLIDMINIIKNKEKLLKEQLSSLSDEEWTSSMKQIEETKAKITETMSQINDSYLDLVRKRLTKRAAKRMRQKKIRLERRREKEDRIQELKERSRKIDENLQKIKDGILRAKMEEDANFQADIILKEVLRKKSDANKSIAKLDALVRLRKARQNTAKGRGEKVSDLAETMFNNNIEKLKSLWLKKLEIYDKEESDLRTRLRRETYEQSKLIRCKERQVKDNLVEWREALFGGGVSMPQVNFQGEVGTFIASRCEWDRYICSEGSPLPVGWVVPPLVARNVPIA